MTRTPLFLLALLMSAGLPALGHAQDVERVRALYVAASYEEALAAIPRVTSPAVRLEVEQYRALCLLALGREAEASNAVEQIVRENPTYLPTSTEMSPRMLSIFAAARVKLLPDIARQVYADGKTAFDSGDDEAAGAAFTRAMAIADTMPEDLRGAVADLRLLAAEFLDLTLARAKPRPGSPSTAGALPAVIPSDAGPVAIEEQLPPWNPPDSAALRSEYTGVLRVQIGEDGRVRSADIVDSSHPTYDVLAARAARGWVYEPATKGGQPVPSHKDIQIRLVPR
jgi:TonB family protein